MHEAVLFLITAATTAVDTTPADQQLCSFDLQYLYPPGPKATNRLSIRYNVYSHVSQVYKSLL